MRHQRSLIRRARRGTALRSDTLVVVRRVAASWLVVGVVGMNAVGCTGDAGGGATPDAAADVDLDGTDNGTLDAAPDEGSDTPTPAQEALRTAIRQVPVRVERTIPGLSAEVHVLRTEGDVPHIYAANRLDLARAAGFLMAQDRYFEFELGSRLALGTLSELMGSLTVDADVDSRGTGMAYVADRILANATADQRALLDAYADGINAWQAALRAGEVEPPTELSLVGPLLGATDPTAVLQPATARSIAGMAAFVVYTSSHSLNDLLRDAAAAQVAAYAPAGPDAALRTAGLERDVWLPVRPVFEVAATPGFQGDAKARGGVGPASIGASVPSSLPASLRARAAARAQRQATLFRRGTRGDHGSNVWAVAATHTENGAALLAGDGHLSLGIPPIFLHMGLDDTVFGDGATHQVGLFLPGFPLLGVGTNGNVAWSQTYPRADVTDVYREEVRLGADGLPDATLYRGEWRPVTRVDETYRVAGTLGDAASQVVWPRWTTFDGRWLIDIEGDEATDDTGAVANMLGDRIRPGDVDSDGVVVGVSMDYTGFDIGDLIGAVDTLGHAADVEAFVAATRSFVGYAQNLGVADAAGDVALVTYTATPCRSDLRGDDGRWVAGGDPTMVLDGTRFGAFRVATTSDAGPNAPEPCAIPFDVWPNVVRPEKGFVANANNDPAGATFDDDIAGDPFYIGGPWDVGARADTIEQRLSALAASRRATPDDMAALQGDHTSRTGQLLAPYLLAALDRAERAAADGGTTGAEASLAASWEREGEALGEVRTRIAAWLAAGAQAESGVETFYHTPTEQQRTDAAATMIFNAWLRTFNALIWDDEGVDFAFEPPEFGRARRLRTMLDFLDGRGDGNPGQLASWNASTGESVFFDDVDTVDVVESSDELIIQALEQTLAALRAPPQRGDGGFGTPDMDAWLWGLRHRARFESILVGFAAGNPAIGVLAAGFSISTERLPLAPSLPAGDPRRALKWFPRPGDMFGVDAATPDWAGDSFDHADGPVMRMVMEMVPDLAVGRNVIPGGQSGIVESTRFDDQARLWLANQTLPSLLHTPSVIAAATSREVFRP